MEDKNNRRSESQLKCEYSLTPILTLNWSCVSNVLKQWNTDMQDGTHAHA